MRILEGELSIVRKREECEMRGIHSTRAFAVRAASIVSYCSSLAYVKREMENWRLVIFGGKRRQGAIAIRDSRDIQIFKVLGFQTTLRFQDLTRISAKPHDVFPDIVSRNVRIFYLANRRC